jgi:predicted nucleic acid-binding protein
LIVVDSSVWIVFFSSSPGIAGAELRRMIEDAEPFAITGVVVSEVLQGLTRNVAQIERDLRQWEMLEPQGFNTYKEAAALFRAARVQGITITTIDALIASIALENNASVFTLDRDFSRIARIVNLPLYVVRERPQ